MESFRQLSTLEPGCARSRHPTHTRDVSMFMDHTAIKGIIVDHRAMTAELAGAVASRA